jgi:hypothetical protein
MRSAIKSPLTALLLAIASGLSAGSTGWVTGKVLASAAADGTGADAPKYSSLTLVRANVPGEFAVQLAGGDPTDPTRIFSPLHAPAYYLSDAGSQWNSAINVGQSVLAIVETMAPQHDWSGQAYAGAVTGTVTKAGLVAGINSMPDLWLSLIPKPALASADDSHISLSITSFNDLGGDLSDLSIWRRTYGSTAWQWQASIANPSASNITLWNDGSVTPENLYEYSITADFVWTGGGGAGSLTSTSGIYSTQSRAISGVFAASAKQPTPTPTPVGPTLTPTPFALPEGWLAYPNPAHGDTLMIAFDANNSGTYLIRAFNLSGELALSLRGSIPQPGRVITQMGIEHLASGIYLMKIDLYGKDGGDAQKMPIRKIAVLK